MKIFKPTLKVYLNHELFSTTKSQYNERMEVNPSESLVAGQTCPSQTKKP